jgi:hypothetical protein
MRSDLVFGAMTYVPNRYRLTTLAARAIRKLHRPNSRIEDTMNDVLERFARNDPSAHGPDAKDLRSFPHRAQRATDSHDESSEASAA